MLQIVTLYRTSKGTFLGKAAAERNRATERDSHDGGVIGKEKVRELKALTDGREYFELTTVVPDDIPRDRL